MTQTGDKPGPARSRPSGQPGTRPTHTPPGGVLVGVDTDHATSTGGDATTGRPTGALVWAAAEARASGRPLHLLTACAPQEPLAPTFGQLATPYTEPQWDEAGEVLTRLAADLADADVAATTTAVSTETATGHATEVLLEACVSAGLLVIGQRRLGAMRRWAEGSTSTDVAGHCRVPVVVVPDDWPPPGTSDPIDAVTVGVDLHPDDLRDPSDGGPGRHLHPHLQRRLEMAEAAVEFAASYAARHGAPLRLLSCWKPPPEFSWSSDQVATHEARRAAALHDWAAPLTEGHADLEVRVETVVGQASLHLLAFAATSCLTVVGQHLGLLRAGGLPIGATTRGLLRHAPGPVAVVPAPTR